MRVLKADILLNLCDRRPDFVDGHVQVHGTVRSITVADSVIRIDLPYLSISVRC